MADYYTLLTNAGIAYETACKAAGTPIKLTQISVGDGGEGGVYNPAATATALKREVWRGPLNALFQDEKNPSWLLAEVTIPPDVGGWYVREAGLWTDTGVLYAIVKYPESFKPILANSGSGKEFYIRSIFETSNASLVTLLIDDTVVKATRAWVMSYLAEELGKLDGKQSVRVAATGNVVMKGAQQIDGVAVIAGDRVLLANQTLAKDNGLWIVANGDWVRANDASTSAKVTPGLTVMVEEGKANGDSLWHLTTNAPITLGTTALTFKMLAGRTGITAGTYKSLTVDEYGRATAGSNPETLAGFGIKDSYTKAEVEALIAKASALPVGSIVAFPVDAPPPGFLELDNSVKSSATYPDLSAYLGGKFNKGDEGVGNFRLPEARGEFLRGWDHGRGVDAGRGLGSWQTDDNKSHSHATAYEIIVDTFAAGDVRRNYVQQYNGTDDVVTKTSGGAEARPRNLAVMWCIKAWNAPINQGSIDIAALASRVEASQVNGPLVGQVRNLRMKVAAPSATATITSDQLIVEQLGSGHYKLKNINLSINLASVGAGGMDSGTAPLSGTVGIYVIYNPDTKIAKLLGVNATAAVVPEVYGGTNMPVGYTASALVSVWQTNANRQLQGGTQTDRSVATEAKRFLSNGFASVFTALSLNGLVPRNAKSIGGYAHVITSATNPAGSTLTLCSDPTGFGSIVFGSGGSVNMGSLAPFSDLALASPLTIYYSANNGPAANNGYVTFYTF
ncbi:phage tail protein [Pseudomonas iridis]|uniref:phage tail-collar fiber domain-containing protein n=1 Tax=Pseudomonas iridis TaxID=2710587 RepID=UPI0037C7AB0B